MGFENVSDKQVTVTQEVKKALVNFFSATINTCDDINVFSKNNLILQITSFNDFNNITALDLSDCNLSEIQLDFVSPKLTHLSLAHNKFEKVPLCLYTSLKTLQFLDLSHNRIKEFDMEPECINNIKTLKLDNNKFKNVPKWFLMFRAVNLEEFDYSKNESTHYHYLRNSYNLHVTKLKQLTLKNCQLVNDDFSFLRCFKHLRNLDISNCDTRFINRFVDLDVLFVKSKWKEMEILRINNLSLCIFPEGITWLESLVELYLTQNEISWLPEGIEFMANLEVLDLSNNNLVAILDKILKLEFLRILKAPYNYIDKAPDFSCMKHLELLDLYDNAIDDISVNINVLQYIDLEMNYIDSSILDYQNEYKVKKTTYRESNLLNRMDGYKNYYCESSSSSRESDDETCDHSNEFCYLKKAPVLEDENWDVPVELKPRNPEIDSEDENWNYEVPLIEPKKIEKIYVEDEDWMFEDAFEEC